MKTGSRDPMIRRNDDFRRQGEETDMSDDEEILICKNCGKICTCVLCGSCPSCGASPLQPVAPDHRFRKEYSVRENTGTVEKNDAIRARDAKAITDRRLDLKWDLQELLYSLWVLPVIALIVIPYLLPDCDYKIDGKYAGRGMTICLRVLFSALAAFLKTFFSSSRKKQAEKAFSRYWNSILGNKKVFGWDNNRYESANVAARDVIGTLPEVIGQSVDQAGFISWISRIRRTITDNNTALAADAALYFWNGETDAAGDLDLMSMQNIRTKKVNRHKAVVSADLIVERKWTGHSNKDRLTSENVSYKISASVLHIATTVLKAGNFWYVADIMPEIEPGTVTNAWQELGSH